VSHPTRLIELPIGASEDRVVGSLDLERALAEGVRAFEPGLLASAHRGVLYVDEVNLLADHLVDVLLDAAAMGRNHVERDAVSITHAARFVLIGSMNPEEGELRPQLLDRFGLTVDVSASRDPEVRVEVVRRRLAADADPLAFAGGWSEAEKLLTERIATARDLLEHVVLPDSALRQIAEVCAAFDVDGMRADIVTARTAAAHAAWSGRTIVTAEDVRAAALLALPHRRRRNPFDEPGLDTEALDEALDRADDEPDPNPDPDGGDEAPSPADPPQPQDSSYDGRDDQSSAPATNAPSGDDSSASPPARTAPTGQARTARALTGSGGAMSTPGRRAPARTGRGRSVGVLSRAASDGPIHLPATVMAAAPMQAARGRRGGPLRFTGADLRRADRRGKEGNLVLFVVDASGSMAARARMTAVKGAVLGLLLDAYRRRDRVGLITFRGTSAEVVLPPTSSVDSAARRLDSITVGGRTPLAAGLAKAVQVIDAERLRDPLRRPLVLLITDGRAETASALRAGANLRRHDVVVIDCESGPVRLRLAQRLAIELGAEYLSMDAVTAGPLGDLVVDRRAA
jgi:magnesium chelatase subunit D